MRIHRSTMCPDKWGSSALIGDRVGRSLLVAAPLTAAAASVASLAAACFLLLRSGACRQVVEPQGNLAGPLHCPAALALPARWAPDLSSMRAPPRSAAGLTFIKGDPVAIPSRAGPMVIEFWATWCAPPVPCFTLCPALPPSLPLSPKPLRVSWGSVSQVPLRLDRGLGPDKHLPAHQPCRRAADSHVEPAGKGGQLRRASAQALGPWRPFCSLRLPAAQAALRADWHPQPAPPCPPRAAAAHSRKLRCPLHAGAAPAVWPSPTCPHWHRSTAAAAWWWWGSAWSKTRPRCAASWRSRQAPPVPGAAPPAGPAGWGRPGHAAGCRPGAACALCCQPSGGKSSSRGRRLLCLLPITPCRAAGWITQWLWTRLGRLRRR